MGFGAVAFGEEDYRQHKGLAMGSPLSAVLASLYMESLEKDHYEGIMGKGSVWWRYVDDVIVVVPEAMDIDRKLQEINNVNGDIQFTVEMEKEKKLPFLDKLIWRREDGVKFSVYRKPTNRDDFIHYLSAHSKKIKSGVLIGFYLRAYRICSQEKLEEELEYVKEAFKKLKYPEGMIASCRRKAKRIASRNNPETGSKTEEKCIVVPWSHRSEGIDNQLGKVGYKVVNGRNTRIGDMVARKGGRDANKNSVIYCVPCSGCPKAYFGESGRGLDKRLREHKADIRAHRLSNSLALHAQECGHLPHWQGAVVLDEGLEKKSRRMIEAAYIATRDSLNHREGFFKLANTTAAMVLSTRVERHSNRVRGRDKISQTRISLAVEVRSSDVGD